MKFADKLFFATTALLTLIFTVFGIWMLSSYFQRVLNRETEQGDTQSRMFQYLFEMAYQSTKKYGEDYAIARAVDSVMDSVESEGTECFVMDTGRKVYYGDALTKREDAAITELIQGLTASDNYVYGIRNTDGRYQLFHICLIDTEERSIYLGICRDLTTIYEDRESLMNQYKLALVILLFAGGACIYLLSRYMTRPISNLEMVAGRIARGNYELRSKYHAKDEIGALAGSFNRMADTLVEHVQEKELEAKQKEDFTAAFAHELKTPLTSIIGYADMLNSVELSEAERREAYFYIYSQGKRLESLSYKLLELVGMDKDSMQKRPVSTKKLEENLRITMRPIFAGRDIKGKITLEKGTIYGDYELLLSLLYNLLDNAVKAIENDGLILLKGRNVEDGYEIRVADNGRGIPEDEIERIKEAFYMVDKSRSRREGGAGIGMALCDRIVNLHGGELQIISKLGDGTVMKLFFPGKEELDEEKEWTE